METIPPQPVDSLTVTTLVDNVTDLLLRDEGPPAVRSRLGPVPGRRRACGPSTASPRW